MDKNYTIRSAEFKDVETIFALIKMYPEEILPRPISDIVENIDRFVVCDLDGKVVGTASWQILPEIGAPTNPSIEIKSLAVEKKFHRTGMGKKLVEEVITRIKKMHPAQIIALTFSPEFFKTLGFKETAKEKLMHKIYMGCINCSKYDSPFTCPETAMVMEL